MTLQAHEVLNYKDHLNLKVIDGYRGELSLSANSIMVFPTEFRDVQAYYPILFRKNPETGEFYACALTGFEPNENLFVSEEFGWQCDYLPLMARREPFFIGFKEDESAPQGKSMIVTLDSNSARLSEDDGEDLFNIDGSPSLFLNDKMAILERIHQGNEFAEGFNQALVENQLLEPATIEITLGENATSQLLGFYVLNEEKLIALPGEVLNSFSMNGYLLPMFMLVASQGQMRKLINMKTEKQSG